MTNRPGRPQDESSTSPYTGQVEGIRTPSVSGPGSQCTGQEPQEVEEPRPEHQQQDEPTFSTSTSTWEQEKEDGHGDGPQDRPSVLISVQVYDKEKLEPEANPRDAPSSSSHTIENDQIVITSVRATNVALGLRRLPAGFYIAIHHSGLEWRTENKRSFVNNDVVEWDGLIPLPSDVSATVRLEVYASFEFQSILGIGELLRRLTLTVEQLLARQHPFTFFPRDEAVVSPCSSISVAVEQWNNRGNDSPARRVLEHHRSAAEFPSELEKATNDGHGALSRYQRHGGKPYLERSVNEFDRALGLCPPDHACLAVAQANLAQTKSILSHVETGVSLEAPMSLYRNVVAARPVGHPDRPSSLVQLAAIHFARFEQCRDEIEWARAKQLLHKAIEVSPTESHEHRAASFMLQMDARDGMNSVQTDESSTEQGSASRFTEEDPWNLSVQLLERFKQFGDLVDLERAIGTMKGLLKMTSLWDSRYCTGLANLGVALSYRFDRLGELGDLEDAMSRQKEAVELTPQGDFDKPSRLSNLAASFIARFERFGKSSDLEEAISAWKDAVDLTPRGHPHRPACLNNLGTSFVARFERLGELSDLESAILMQKDAVELTPQGHPDKPSGLSNLANSFLTRFKRLGVLSDLEKAISALKVAVDLTPHSHPQKLACLHNLGTSFKARFSCLGELSDLESAISMQKDAVELTPQGHPHKPSRLNNLATSFLTRFEHLGGLSDLEEAILMQKVAVELTPQGHPDKLSGLNNLANSFLTRFKHLGGLSDLEEAISMQKDAVELTPRSHPDKPGYLNNLANSFRVRFEHLGGLSNLEEAISMQKDVVELTPQGHPDKPRYLSNLANSFLTCFEHLGGLSDLEEAISIQKDAVELTPQGHPDKPRRLNNLGNSFLTRFKHLGGLSDLEEAISMQKDAVELTPQGHPDKPNRLNNLGTSFRARFSCLGDLGDLESAISMQKNAVELTPRGHPDKLSSLNNLANSFLTCFQHLGGLSDLEEAISTLKATIDLTPHNHPQKLACLHNLGTSFFARFSRLGELSDLESAISMQKDAVELTPQGHPDKPSRLNNLATSFLTRFEHLGGLSDLEEAISALKAAVDLTPHSHPQKPACLDNLGTSFFTRFSRFGELSDLESAISMQKDAVELTPQGHPDKPSHLNNLANSFLTRFERLRGLSDLEEAISALKAAVDLTPHGHPQKLARLHNLGTSFFARFSHLGELNDLESAILMQKDAVELTPQGHPHKPSRLSSLANSFRARFERLRELRDLQLAISLYSHAASSPVGPANLRFRASQNWISCAQRIRHNSLLRAFSTAITLLPQLSWTGLSLRHRFSQLIRGADVVREAAAAALNAGLPETAVEWLEQGRSIIWGELLQLRTSDEELHAAYPNHARRLQELSSALENASTIHEKSFSSLSDHARSGTQEAHTILATGADEQTLSTFIQQTHAALHQERTSMQRDADRHRTLAIQRDKLLQEIRTFPGFERFLLQKEFYRLRASTHAGPVVILNAAETRCDALAILPNIDHPIHVPLPNITLKQCTHLQNTLTSLVRDARAIRSGERAPLDDSRWEPFLSPLWKSIVKPVLDALAFSSPGDLSRIFWCPTGPFTFLPIHAAGLYDRDFSQLGYKVYDFVVSSYVPSVSVLALSRNPTASPSDTLRLLAVPQPPSDGQVPLPGVHKEVARIQDIFKNSPCTQATLVKSATGTVEEVLGLMKETDWVHFACHGVQDTEDPVDSGLCLADKRRLSISDIIGLSRPRGGLAFLSACQTAKGDKHLSDEAIHIAAGMLFAGYGGVIGTMWSISDAIAPDVAEDVYLHLLWNCTKPDYREAARALHDAVSSLRERGVPFDEWLPFVHVGH